MIDINIVSFEEKCVTEIMGVCVWASNNGSWIPLPNLAVVFIAGVLLWFILFFLYIIIEKNKGDEKTNGSV